MDNELYHHGILGMKWGQHRFKDSSGHLTEKGKHEFDKVSRSSFKSALQNNTAKRIYSNELSRSNVMSKSYNNASDRSYKKADKYVYKSEKYHDGNTHFPTNKKKFEKYQGKAWKELAKSYKYGAKVDKMDSYSKMLRRKISDISDGKVKAGRDFIVQTDWDFYPTFAAIKKQTIITKD